MWNGVGKEEEAGGGGIGSGGHFRRAMEVLQGYKRGRGLGAGSEGRKEGLGFWVWRLDFV